MKGGRQVVARVLGTGEQGDTSGRGLDCAVPGELQLQESGTGRTAAGDHHKRAKERSPERFSHYSILKQSIPHDVVKKCEETVRLFFHLNSTLEKTWAHLNKCRQTHGCSRLKCYLNSVWRDCRKCSEMCPNCVVYRNMSRDLGVKITELQARMKADYGMFLNNDDPTGTDDWMLSFDGWFDGHREYVDVLLSKLASNYFLLDVISTTSSLRFL